ncbi:carotenoid oxygenase family protein [Cupriavidus sp. CV2]|uniref:carotenoid oxygenase family protein n=1 Tax=Cupriavidus ulmosensis TaxID=3065913 RepID=UPI00296B0663|nr:carotenoid oxygenase family protein [Cupriavidus sp. CV2]MDW3688552.1 carotenoid oxygenase family protein [Cupriavidus sp. CV2]
MSQPFPSTPYLSGNFAPILMECDAPDLPVLGELPRALRGTLYRNGPNPQYAPRDAQYHWFIGDGMVHAFHIEDGRVRYRNRWVRTNKFQREQAAGQALFGSWGNPATTDPSVLGQNDGVANTNILCHAGRLLALEEADLPVELDTRTLATRGDVDYGGKLTGAMTAHPKVDPVTGEMVFFAYSADGPFTPGMRYGVVDRNGQLQRLEHFEAPFPSMVHDFMVTQKHVLFPILPLAGSMERAMRGEPAYAWEPQKGSHIGIMPRNGSTAQMRWFRGEACYVFHVMNAWDAGNKVIADVMQYESSPIFNPNGSGTGVGARLCRWTFDMAGKSDTFTREYLDDTAGEFPRFDERFSTLPYHHGYYVFRRHESSERGGYDSLAHLDMRSGKRATYQLPAGDAFSEPVFVPRAADSAEGDGWLLATVYRGAEVRSDLVVLDAGAIADGPVATVQLSHRVPFGFHGNWHGAD